MFLNFLFRPCKRKGGNQQSKRKKKKRKQNLHNDFYCIRFQKVNKTSEEALNYTALKKRQSKDAANMLSKNS